MLDCNVEICQYYFMANNPAKCNICPRECLIPEDGVGFCRVRSNIDGEIVCSNYGKVTAMALDPIEKKPLRNYMPGSNILSVGSYGCNLTCGFCQNNRISMSDGFDIQVHDMSPETIVGKAEELMPSGNIGLAYTYNEPLIGYEFVRDCAKLIHEREMKNVVVSNGFINEEPLKKLLPLIDASNIDLKAFNPEFYKKVGGDLDVVKRSIELYAEVCHLEITTLIIPGENDSEDEIDRMCNWIAGINPNIPLHLSRFFPCYKYSDRIETSRDTIDRLYDIATQHLTYVYKGNY